LALLIVTVCVSHAMQEAFAQDTVTYSKSKNFTLTPGGNVVPQVFAIDVEHAWVLDPTLRSDVSVAQPATFNPGGADRVGVTSNGFIGPMNTGFPPNPTVDILTRSTPINAAGGKVVHQAQVNPPINSSLGQTTINVNPFGAGGKVTGSIAVNGTATANPGPVPSEAYAFSYGAVVAVGGVQLGMGQGVLNLPFVDTNLGGTAHAGGGQDFSHIFDPVTFSVSDPVTGQVTYGTLFQLNTSLIGNGTMSLSSNGLFSVDATNASFTLNMDSPYIPASEQGDINLVITNGAITTSVADGIFAGFLPPVGSSGTFSSLLPGTDQGAIAFDYNLGLGSDPVVVSIDASDAGDAFTSASVPEPGSFILAITATLVGAGSIWLRRREATALRSGIRTRARETRSSMLCLNCGFPSAL
jgi:hypothetical protein